MRRSIAPALFFVLCLAGCSLRGDEDEGCQGDCEAERAVCRDTCDDDEPCKSSCDDDEDRCLDQCFNR